jgi:prepilin-type N-terminal cleavage/methylation domain-containing protein
MTMACSTAIRRVVGFTLLELIVVISVMAVLASMGFASWKYIKRQVDIGATQTLVQAVSSAITNYGPKTFSWYDMNPPVPPSTVPTVTSTTNPVQHVAFLWDLNSPNVVKPPAYSGGTNSPDLPINGKFPGVNLKYDSIDGTPPDPTKPSDTSLSKGGGGFTTDVGEPRDNRDGWIPGCSFFGNSISNPTYVGLWYAGYRGFYDMCQPSIAKNFINSKHQPIDSWKQPLRIAYAANTYGSAWFGVWSAGPDLTDETPDDIQSWTNHASN